MQNFTKEYVEWLIQVNLEAFPDFTSLPRRADLLFRFSEELSELFLADADTEDEEKEIGDVLAIGTLLLHSFGLTPEDIYLQIKEFKLISKYRSLVRRIMELSKASRKLMAGDQSQIVPLICLVLDSVIISFRNCHYDTEDHLKRIAATNKDKLVKRLAKDMMFTGSGDNRENESP